MSGSGWECIPNIWEWLRDPSRCPGVAGCPPGCPEVVGSPSLMSGNVREAHLDVCEWSGGPPGCPGVIWKPSLMFGSGQEFIPDVRERTIA